MISKRVFKPGLLRRLRILLEPTVLSLLMLTLILFGLMRTEQSAKKQGLIILEQSIRKAAVRCYAIEGAYPCDIDYMETRYGVRVDRTKYAVYYEIFADNVMPYITVVELGGYGYE